MEGNFQSLRSMWNTKVQEEQKLLKPKTVIYRSQSELVQKASSTKNERRSIMIADETVSHKKELTVTFDDQKISDLKAIEKLSSVDESEDTIPLLPPPPPSIVFKGQAQSISIMKQSVSKMFNFDKKKTHFNNLKTNGIRHWHIARHVFRSGLIFSPTRRASDSILPLLIRTHIAQYQSRTASLDSIFTPTPLENLIDYLTYDNDNKQMNIPEKKVPVKRMISDTGACIERNKLNDTIAQYEVLMRHLKNYDKFMATYPVPPSSSSPKRKSIDTEDIRNKNGGDDDDNIQQISTATSSIRSRQTQSLARNVGRTFTDFIMNDLLLLPVSKTSSDEPRRLSTIHAASQTDLIELIPKEAEEEEEIKQVVDELNTIIKNIEDENEEEEKGKEAEVEEEEEEKPEEVPLTANSEINVVIVNSSEMQVAEQEVAVKIQQNGEKSLIQRLFEGKKTAYTPDDIQMETTRIPEELMNTFEIAKRKCFFNTERVLYATKMIKIDRRGYKQHVRIFCITTERLYIITKKDPYPKEAVLFKDVLGISCTPRNDGFICLHTRETREDRGDWIFLVDHPCECITQIFTALGRNDNNDHYLKIKTEFKHTRRSLATVPDDCSIASRSADTFHIEFENYEVLAIVR
ncbi:unnamed protein product [Adineta steineri]|uniref:TH1 domain-containing protein n=1 Tax=Adineta steineri TaxID=433720 RepID=A0A814Q400_9BILA|nr:unnamed protein product [Adineta steineri]CAF4030624.1 unnamed protein product [Adineta steineri]